MSQHQGSMASRQGAHVSTPPGPPLPLAPLLMVCAPLGRPTRHSPTSLDRKLDGNNDDDEEEENDDDEEEEDGNCNVGRS